MQAGFPVLDICKDGTVWVPHGHADTGREPLRRAQDRSARSMFKGMTTLNENPEWRRVCWGKYQRYAKNMLIRILSFPDRQLVTERSHNRPAPLSCQAPAG
jgi:hypothetical protein